MKEGRNLLKMQLVGCCTEDTMIGEVKFGTTKHKFIHWYKKGLENGPSSLYKSTRPHRLQLIKIIYGLKC